MKETNKKNKGFILISVVIILALLFILLTSVNMMAVSHGNNVIHDTKKDKAYYIANAGLEIVYSALNKGMEGDESPSVIEVTGKEGSSSFKDPQKNIINTELTILSPDNEPLGYCDIKADLEKDTDLGLYYRVIATGKIDKDSNSQSDSRILTMFVYPNAVGNFLPKVYDGYKENP